MKYRVYDRITASQRRVSRRTLRGVGAGDEFAGDSFFRKSGRGDAVVLEYGGNVCEFDWAAIADHPGGEHSPLQSPEDFKRLFLSLIHRIRRFDGAPILLTLPPLRPYRFVLHVSQGLNGSNILRWLGGDASLASDLYEPYDEALRVVAAEQQVALIDLTALLTQRVNVDQYYCADGIHLNQKGEALVARAIRDFTFS